MKIQKLYKIYKTKYKMKRGKIFLEILNSKPVIGALIFVMLSLATVIAGDVIVKEGSLNTDKIGIGIESPELELHIFGDNSPGIRLDQSDETYSAQIWDIQGSDVGFFVQDVTNSKIPFRIEVGAPMNALYVDSSGDIGIGTSSPRSIVDVDKGTGYGQITFDGSSGGCLMLRDTDDAGWTKCTALDGVLTCTTDADGIC